MNGRILYTFLSDVIGLLARSVSVSVKLSGSPVLHLILDYTHACTDQSIRVQKPIDNFFRPIDCNGAADVIGSSQCPDCPPPHWVT